LPHFWYIFVGTVDVVSRGFLKISSLCEADTQHIFLLTSNGEVVLLALMIHHINFLKVIFSQGVQFEDSGTLGALDEERNREQDD
jgi:hypothetical protein